MRIDSPSADNLTHDRVEREAVGFVDILVARQPSIDRQPKQPGKPVDGVLAPAVVALIETDRRTLETTELESRVAALEGGSK